MKNIRGYNLSVSIKLFGYKVFICFYPLIFRAPLLIVPINEFCGASHFLFGPIHIWAMQSFQPFGIGVEIDIRYDAFWYHNPSIPLNYNRII